MALRDSGKLVQFNRGTNGDRDRGNVYPGDKSDRFKCRG
jgi:hypothetical protein